jgi:hypothetical protein
MIANGALTTDLEYWRQRARAHEKKVNRLNEELDRERQARIVIEQRCRDLEGVARFVENCVAEQYVKDNLNRSNQSVDALIKGRSVRAYASSGFSISATVTRS